MVKTRFRILFTIFSMMALSLLLPRMMAAQDAGEYLILSAQYGSERNHVDVTERLKYLARQDRTFRVGHNSMEADPDQGHSKALRVFARGPNGRERMFDFPDGSVFDGAQFRGWRGGDWGHGGWSGNWNGGGGNEGGGGGNRDEGEFLILSAQYGTRRDHVDVTQRLKELASADRMMKMDNHAFGVDPAPNQVKVLRIYARGPNGSERMFEYREGTVIDGAQFRGWGRGDWGAGNYHWSGNWDVPQR
jgi:hypothetical protein